MSLINDYFINYEVRQHHAELIAEAQNNRLARLARQAQKARIKLQRRLLGSQQPAPLDPHAPVDAPAETLTDADSASASTVRVPVGAGRINSL
ncbi:hypothetical protein [Microlunatus speluncae]|uniref:hypothetical protein n=1 Tax=Microlunatus speluncae TaxID=2594267 RepID=UPI0012661C5E|nr:hypothetical protein [Microlunatus speluncae]